MYSRASSEQIEAAYKLASERYAAIGIDAAEALDVLSTIPISLHCWQGDDVGGFESPDMELSGGIAAIGNYPGKARSPDELRRDLDMVYTMVPGTHRLALHAIYAETGGELVPRDELLPEHFSGWVEWARANDHGLDFNPTLFSHPMADSGFTLSSYDADVRSFWIDHCIACRRIGEYFGRELGTPCVTNIWIPDGLKDTPIDRAAPRALLRDSLDAIFAQPIDPRVHLDAVECKLFGLGSESYVVGSHEFYLAYAALNDVLLCLDAGHFHPTEVISDKLSSVLLFVDQVLLHISRGVRWDSDHVVVLSDECKAIAQEIVRGGYLDRVHIGLDFFDASINRIAAWSIGARSVMKALLLALLEPTADLRRLEVEGDYTARLTLLEEFRMMPAGAVWDYFCAQQGAPVGAALLDEVRAYEARELPQRV